MAVSSVLSVRVNEKDEQILSQIAEATGTTKSKLVAEAIRNYVEMNAWYMQEIEARIQMADRGEFASKERVNALYAKYGVVKS